MAANQHMNFGSQLFGCINNFDRAQPKNGLGLAEMGHQELVSQQTITHWLHMEVMEWSIAATDEVAWLQTT